MTDFVIVLILIIAIGAALRYIVKAKKNGTKCIGCPISGQCSGNYSTKSNCGCMGNGEKKCDCHTNEK